MRGRVTNLIPFALLAWSTTSGLAQGQQAGAPTKGGATTPRAAAPAPAARPAAPAPAPARPDPKRMDGILDAWSQRSKTVKSLYARFTREDVVHAWQDRSKYDGQAYLMSPNLAYLNFEKVGEDGKPAPYERIVCTGDRVYHFMADSKQVHVYTLAQQERQRALEEGPLPFLFNMDAAQARLRYQMTLLQENEELYLIAITPLQKVDREAFSRAYIYLDRTRFLPTKIQLVDPNNGKDTKTFTIAVVQPNVKIAEAYFDAASQTRQVIQADKKWDIVEYNVAGEPIGKPPATAPASGATAAPGAAVRRPAAAAAAPPPRTTTAPRR